ncbi:MFS transporter [Phormidium tenue FACHB-886]|nr:MFS transporter [Phormidium tenue FACHB-886]
MFKKLRVQPPLQQGATLAIVLLAIECLDEWVYGARSVALPLMQQELHLSYTQLGLLSTIPDWVSNLAEPVLGIWADAGRRRRCIAWGGVAFGAALGLVGLSPRWAALLIAFCLLHPASGAFVSLSQAMLMDLERDRHELNMARWMVASSVGVVAGALSCSAVVFWGGNWRWVFGGLAILSWGLVLVFQRVSAAVPVETAVPDVLPTNSFWHGVRQALAALRRPVIWRWLLLVQLADLMLDIFTDLLPLYLVSAARFSEAEAGLAVALCSGIDLLGSVLLIPLLPRVDARAYLRITALLLLVAFPTFLLVPSALVKLAMLCLISLGRSAWYPILTAQLYAALPNQSSLVLSLSTLTGQISPLMPLLLGMVADRLGLTTALWVLLLGPISLLLGVPSRSNIQ